jgi:type II secretory pathway pseudopilin PulG
MTTLHTTSRRAQRAFTLLEILIVTTIIISIGAGLLLTGARRLEYAAIQAEDARLDQIATDIQRSLDSEDFDSTNLLALSGMIPAATTATTFSSFTTTSGLTATADQWFSKVARVRGLNVSYGAAVTQSTQPELYKIAFNTVGQPRLLILGPTTETDKQRLVLVSLMARPEKQQLPAYQNTTAWFDAIFGTNWATSSQSLPSLWTTLLTATQQSAWNGTTSGGTNLWRLRTYNITIPKHILSISNGHPSLNLTVTTDGGASSYTVVPGQVQLTNPIIDGRTVLVYQGSSTTPLRNFAMRKKSSVIVE